MTIGTNTSGHLFDTTFTTNGVLYSAASGVATSTAAGTSGQLLRSSGAGSAPAYTTATYPATAGTSGKILISDGTNIVSSTPTYPAAAGTSGNVLTSDGTNWTSAAAAGGGLLSATWSLTSLQIKALHATPIQVIAAPGAGKIICVVSVTFGKFTYGGTNVFVAASAQTLSIYYGTATKVSDLIPNSSITGTATLYSTLVQSSGTAITPANIENLAVNMYNPIVTEITGNAANNNTASGIIVYYIATL